MEKKGTQFGILITKSIPDDALTENVFRDGVLIVPLQNVEIAYIYARKYLILSHQLESLYQTRNSKLEVKNHILNELRDAVSNGELDKLISKINIVSLEIDKTIQLIEDYLGQRFGDIRKKTERIRVLSNQLLNDHITTIRDKLLDGMNNQLMQQPITQSTSAVDT